MEEAWATPDAALYDIARRNHGVILTSDALAFGVTNAGLTRRVAKETDALEDALDSALRRRLTSVNRLRLRVRADQQRNGIRRLRSLLAERDDKGHPSASRFETRLNRLFLSAGLPSLRRFTIWDGGEFVARVDFCFPEAKLIVEADGYRWHSNRRAWQRDRERRNRLTSLGWQVIQVTWEDLIRRPDRTIDRVRSMLQPRLPLM